MEVRLSLFVALLLAALGVVANALSLPTDELKDNALQVSYNFTLIFLSLQTTFGLMFVFTFVVGVLSITILLS